MFAAGFACCEDLAIKAPRMFPQTAQHLSRCPQLLLVVLDLAGPDQSGQRCADEHPFSVDRIGGAIVAVPVRAGRRHRSSCGRLALRAGGGDELGALHVAQRFAVAVGFREFDLIGFPDLKQADLFWENAKALVVHSHDGAAAGAAGRVDQFDGERGGGHGYRLLSYVAEIPEGSSPIDVRKARASVRTASAIRSVRPISLMAACQSVTARISLSRRVATLPKPPPIRTLVSRSARASSRDALPRSLQACSASCVTCPRSTSQTPWAASS